MTAHRSLQDDLLAERRILDPGNAGDLKVDRGDAYFGIEVAAGAETRKVNELALPTADRLGVGNRCTVALEATGGGTLAVTVVDSAGADQAINVAGNTTATLSAAGAFVEFVTVEIGGSLKWRLTHSDGAVLS